MTEIKIFKSDKVIDVERLVDTRGLICSNSGGGKSYTARKILEETSGKVMSIVFDVDGELKTLREKFDFLLIGNTEEGADVEINMRAAELLPKKIMELGVSTIIDISNFSWKDRILYVKKFLRALLNLPRNLWKAVIVFLDESHKFCGQQEKQESTFEVIDLMSLGRKRGICGLLATQRIAKLHKDAVAECNNVFVGRIWMDIDQKRAGDILGFTNKKDILDLRNLNDGEFWVFGPAIGRDVEKQQVAESKTTHPKRGMDLSQNISKPTEKIKSILSKISDLPQQAVKELKDTADYKNEIARLTIELKKRPVETQVREVFKTDEKLIERARQQGFNEANSKFKQDLLLLNSDKKKLQARLDSIAKIIGQPINYSFVEKSIIRQDKVILEYNNHTGGESGFDSHQSESSAEGGTPSLPKGSSSSTLMKDKGFTHFSSVDNVGNGSLEIKFGICERKIYSLLFANPERGFTKVQISLLTGYSVNSGSFGNALAKLNSFGLIKRDGNMIFIKDLNNEIATEQGMVFNKDNLLNNLGKCSREIMEVLLEEPDREFSKEEISELTQSGYSVTSGSFGNSLAQLNSLQLLIRKNSKIKLNPEVLEL